LFLNKISLQTGCRRGMRAEERESEEFEERSNRGGAGEPKQLDFVLLCPSALADDPVTS